MATFVPGGRTRHFGRATVITPVWSAIEFLELATAKFPEDDFWGVSQISFVQGCGSA